jgi:putative oxidoreductase
MRIYSAGEAATSGALPIIAHKYFSDLMALASRLSMAAIFYRSGQTKVDVGMSLNDSAFMLFREEYQLPLIPPDWAAYLTTYAEHLFPLMLVLGILTRSAASAMLVMVAVIEVFVYPDSWPTHLSWAVLLVYLIGFGPGRLSLDAWYRSRRLGNVKV